MRRIATVILGVAFIIGVFGVGISIAKRVGTIPTAPDLKVAFIADQGTTNNAIAVLRLIKDEGAELVVHAGDFDYEDDPDKWDANITRVLGAKFPYLVSAGNHDVGPWYLFYYPWPQYQDKVKKRISSNRGVLSCTGSIGENSFCKYKGLHIGLSGPDVIGADHAKYLQSRLKKSKHIWKICSWHKVMETLQVSQKNDEAGWDVYETCRKNGALIINGHEHVYDRTKTLVDMPQQIMDSNPQCSTNAVACVAPGKTIKIGSGLGGHSTDNQTRCFDDNCEGVWASIYTHEQNAQYGALFIVFNVNGDPYRAHAYFKTIDGRIIDEFDIIAQQSVGSSESNNVPLIPIIQRMPILKPSMDSGAGRFNLE